MAITPDLFEEKKSKEETSLERYRKLKEQIKRKIMKDMERERIRKNKAEIKSLEDII